MKKRNVLLMAALPFFAIAPGHASQGQKAAFIGRNFAHRGLYEKDQSIPENSLRAFKRAVAEGYGIELDVQLSKDGKVVVFHDDNLKRMCGVDARVDEYTYDELKQFALAGSEEDHIPLFTEVLAAVDGKSPLIVELKTGRKNNELCEKTYAFLQKYHKNACIESFNPLIVAWFHWHAPEILRGQLTALPDKYTEQSDLQKFILSNCLLNFLARPQFIAHDISDKTFPVRMAEKLGAIKVCWTSHSEKNEDNNDAVIFEYYKPVQKYR